ncbi:hypothetical protein QQ056_05710 [Oscillatoria laete-virens NRMC-F 0139]|nr:hypothetical protein [Oscillatoria laete-virens]MDL5053047.1 hypothetical protein [Oscillatoria laete-virens NRMC-F 0139]
MTRTTIVIPDELKTQAFDYSRRKGMTFGEFVRQAIEEKMHDEKSGDQNIHQKKARQVRKLLDFAAPVYSGPPDLTANLDDYLYGGGKSEP